MDGSVHLVSLTTNSEVMQVTKVIRLKVMVESLPNLESRMKMATANLKVHVLFVTNLAILHAIVRRDRGF
jgi:hypothetical protein